MRREGPWLFEEGPRPALPQRDAELADLISGFSCGNVGVVPCSRQGFVAQDLRFWR